MTEDSKSHYGAEVFKGVKNKSDLLVLTLSNYTHKKAAGFIYSLVHLYSVFFFENGGDYECSTHAQTGMDYGRFCFPL